MSEVEVLVPSFLILNLDVLHTVFSFFVDHCTVSVRQRKCLFCVLFFPTGAQQCNINLDAVGFVQKK